MQSSWEWKLMKHNNSVLDELHWAVRGAWIDRIPHQWLNGLLYIHAFFLFVSTRNASVDYGTFVRIIVLKITAYPASNSWFLGKWLLTVESWWIIAISSPLRVINPCECGYTICDCICGMVTWPLREYYNELSIIMSLILNMPHIIM